MPATRRVHLNDRTPLGGQDAAWRWRRRTGSCILTQAIMEAATWIDEAYSAFSPRALVAGSLVAPAHSENLHRKRLPHRSKQLGGCAPLATQRQRQADLQKQRDHQLRRPLIGAWDCSATLAGAGDRSLMASQQQKDVSGRRRVTRSCGACHVKPYFTISRHGPTVRQVAD